ncbi:MAG: hypothetical protein V3V05_12065 [Pontiella sp.]
MFQLSDEQPVGEFGLEFGTVPGRLYTIECTDGLVEGSWNVVTSYVGNGESAEFDDPANLPSCMFRINVELIE